MLPHMTPYLTVQPLTTGYVCVVYIYIYIYTFMCVYVCMYTYICVCMCVCVYTFVYVCVYLCVFTDINIPTHYSHSFQVLYNSFQYNMLMTTQNIVIIIDPEPGRLFPPPKKFCFQKSRYIFTTLT